MVQTNRQKTTAMTIKVVRSTFRGAGVLGDYRWMINQPEFARALFIFNDNEEQFDAYVAGEARGFAAGGGNAAIRPLRRHVPPRAAGVPTGKDDCGYSALDATTKSKIDEALAVINTLLKSGDYDQIVVSKDKDDDTLGTGIYEVALEVRDYIYQQLVKP